MTELKMYQCDVCGNLIAMIHDSGVTPVCCGEEMSLVPVNTEDASFEKHIPVIHMNGQHIHIDVGEEPHPMTDSHYIEWIALVTDCGLYAHRLMPGEKPAADFLLNSNEILHFVYAYCNIHGLWCK